MSQGSPAPSVSVELSSGELTVVAYPAHGFVITSIVPVDSGVNLLWQRPAAPLHDLGASVGPAPAIEEFDEFVFAGGWFTMFPLAGIPGADDLLPMHGEAPRVAWEVVTVSDTSVTCRVDLSDGFAVMRTLTVNGRTLSVTTRALNNSADSVEVTFGEHPCFSRAVFEGGVVDAGVRAAWVTAEASESDATRFDFPQSFDWPFARRHDRSTDDVSQIPTSADGRHDHLCATLSSAELRVSSPRLDGTLVLRVDLDELPHLLLWEHYSPPRTPWQGDVFALELCSAPGRTLDDARSAGPIAVVGPGESVAWAVSAEWSPGAST